MSSVLESIRNITHLSQQMKTSINRLKNQVAGYLSGSHADLGPESEDIGNVGTIVNKINRLDTNDWNANLLALQQLRYLLTDKTIRNPYNIKHIDLANQLIGQLDSNVDTIYGEIDKIQNTMNSLRQKTAVRGRDTGLTEKGTVNPFGMSSPAEEFGVLEQVLSKIYQNPFDEEAQFYAQKMHSRLEDRLRYIRSPKDEQLDSWMSAYPPSRQTVPPEMPASAPTEPQEVPGEANQQTQDAELESNIFPGQNVEKEVEDLLNPDTASALGKIRDKSSPQEFADAIAEILHAIGANDQSIRALRDAVISRSQGENSPVKQEDPYPSRSIEFPPKPTTPAETSAPVPQPAPTSVDAKDKEPVAKAKRKSVVFPPGKEQDQQRIQELLAIAEAAEASLEPEAKDPIKSAMTLYDLIRVADIVDEYDPEIADVIDEYIKKNKDIVTRLPYFPAIAKITKGQRKTQYV